MRSLQVSMGALNPVTHFLQRERQRAIGDRGEGRVEMEAETGAPQPLAKAHLEPPEARGGKNTYFKLPAFNSSPFNSGRELISIVLSHQGCGNLLQQAQESNMHNWWPLEVVKALWMQVTK